jgi:succinate dehydrogenase / fumarate reductase iron-sulfur subunit
MRETVRLQIRRRASAGHPERWEEFEVPRHSGMNVITALQEIQKNPKTTDGRATTPVTWEASCLEEVCGACSMVINGRVRQACSALVDQLEEPIRLEPMTKFPLVRDLAVDRSRMFGALKRVKAWIEIDGTHDLGPGPRVSQAVQERTYILSTCMTCGCCLEACPQVTLGGDFIGPASISQVRLFNAHPTGALQAAGRIEGLMGPGGLNDCGNAQNCVRVCPKQIPLTESIAEMGRQVTVHALKKLFSS